MNKHPAIGPELEPRLGPGPDLRTGLGKVLPHFILSSPLSMLEPVINSGTKDTADGGWTSSVVVVVVDDDDDDDGNDDDNEGDGIRYTRYSHTFMVGTNDDDDDKAKNSTAKVVLVMCRVVIR